VFSLRKAGAFYIPLFLQLAAAPGRPILLHFVGKILEIHPKWPFKHNLSSQINKMSKKSEKSVKISLTAMWQSGTNG
jgi:hypothetical protein